MDDLRIEAVTTMKNLLAEQQATNRNLENIISLLGSIASNTHSQTLHDVLRKRDVQI